MAYGNAEVDSGSGIQVGADLISSVVYQALKLIDPTEGSTDPIGIPSNPLSVRGSIPSGIGVGAKTVASAGTAEALASSTACVKIIMTAEDDNSGKIYYGGSSVSSTSGDYLFPAQKITLEIDNLSKVYIDADTNTDGVKFTYFTA